jgi:hypothetical protein
MLFCAGESCAKPKKETDAKKSQRHEKVGICETALVTNDGGKRRLLVHVPAVAMRSRDAVRRSGGNWATGSQGRVMPGPGKLLRERARSFEIESQRWHRGGCGHATIAP